MGGTKKRNGERTRSAELAAKRQRVLKLAGVMETTDSALAHIVSTLAVEIDPPASFTRQDIGTAVAKEWAAISTTIDIPLENGGTHVWEHCRFDKLVNYFCRECPSWKALMARTLLTFGTMLTLLVYFDEVTPGNPLRPDNHRKYHAIYVSIKEFGSVMLSNSAVWLPVAVLRSAFVKKAIGGFSHCMRLLATSWYLGPLQLDTLGFVVELDRPRIMLSKWCRTIADGDAHRAFFNIKGASAIRPCPICRNVLKKNHKAARRSRYAVDISCTNYKTFDYCTDADSFANYDRLAAAHGVLGAGKFKALEQAMGLSYNPLSIIGLVALRHMMLPVSQIVLDWMHCFFVGGIFNHTVQKLMRVGKKVCNFELLRTYIGSDWILPGYIRGLANLNGVFTDGREKAMFKSKGGMKGSASEMLTVYPMMRRFVESFVVGSAGGSLDSGCAVFIAICDLIDTIMAAKKGFYINVEEGGKAIRDATILYMDITVKTWGRAGTWPKFHWVWHIWQQFLRDGAIYDTFALERKHQLTKHFASKVRNSLRFDKSVTMRSILEQRRQLLGMELVENYIVQSTCSPELATALGMPTVDNNDPMS